MLLAGGTWRAPNAPSVSYSSLQDAPNAMSPLRVVSVTKRINNGDDRKFLLRSDSNRIYAIHVSDLINRPFTAHLIFPAHQLAYLVGGVAYHCERIADLYAEIGVQFSKFLQIDPDFGRSGIANLQFQPEPYYEFDALIGSAKRSYDSTRYLLWHKFGKGGSVPRSLEALLDSPLALPEQLRHRLTNSWANFGKPVTHYRDCIHHYVTVDFGLATASMRRHASKAWMTIMRIPDNPEARSKRNFTFARGLDALTYAWELADEVLSIAEIVVEAVAPRPSANDR